jgi:hypothetical protein
MNLSEHYIEFVAGQTLFFIILYICTMNSMKSFSYLLNDRLKKLKKRLKSGNCNINNFPVGLRNKIFVENSEDNVSFNQSIFSKYLHHIFFPTYEEFNSENLPFSLSFNSIFQIFSFGKDNFYNPFAHSRRRDQLFVGLLSSSMNNIISLSNSSFFCSSIQNKWKEKNTIIERYIEEEEEEKKKNMNDDESVSLKLDYNTESESDRYKFLYIYKMNVCVINYVSNISLQCSVNSMDLSSFHRWEYGTKTPQLVSSSPPLLSSYTQTSSDQNSISLTNYCSPSLYDYSNKTQNQNHLSNNNNNQEIPFLSSFFTSLPTMTSISTISSLSTNSSLVLKDCERSERVGEEEEENLFDYDYLLCDNDLKREMEREMEREREKERKREREREREKEKYEVFESDYEIPKSFLQFDSSLYYACLINNSDESDSILDYYYEQSNYVINTIGGVPENVLEKWRKKEINIEIGGYAMDEEEVKEENKLSHYIPNIGENWRGKEYKEKEKEKDREKEKEREYGESIMKGEKINERKRKAKDVKGGFFERIEEVKEKEGFSYLEKDCFQLSRKKVRFNESISNNDIEFEKEEKIERIVKEDNEKGILNEDKEIEEDNTNKKELEQESNSESESEEEGKKVEEGKKKKKKKKKKKTVIMMIMMMMKMMMMIMMMMKWERIRMTFFHVLLLK